MSLKTSELDEHNGSEQSGKDVHVCYEDILSRVNRCYEVGVWNEFHMEGMGTKNLKRLI